MPVVSHIDSAQQSSQSAHLGSREVQFLDRQESRFPHLMRLSMDFSFRVLENLKTDTADLPNKSYTLVTDDYRRCDNAAITDDFECLSSLNEHVGTNMVEILHDYLFGFVEDDIQMV